MTREELLEKIHKFDSLFTVTGIEATKRKVTLVSKEGKKLNVTADPEIRNFEPIESPKFLIRFLIENSFQSAVQSIGIAMCRVLTTVCPLGRNSKGFANAFRGSLRDRTDSTIPRFQDRYRCVALS